MRRTNILKFKAISAASEKNFHQPEAFAEFDSVAKEVESDKRFASLLAFGKTMCNPSPAMSVNRHRPGACPEGPPCTPGD
jgi:hypothetical protein